MVSVGMAVKSNMFRTKEDTEQLKKSRNAKAHCNTDGVCGEEGKAFHSYTTLANLQPEDRYKLIRAAVCLERHHERIQERKNDVAARLQDAHEREQKKQNQADTQLFNGVKHAHRTVGITLWTTKAQVEKKLSGTAPPMSEKQASKTKSKDGKNANKGSTTPLAQSRRSSQRTTVAAASASSASSSSSACLRHPHPAHAVQELRADAAAEPTQVAQGAIRPAVRGEPVR